MYSTIAGVNIVCAIISAKWAMELDYSQARQLLFLVGGLIYVFGAKIQAFIDRYFNLLAVAFTVLLVGGFVLIKLVF